jgi:hypothetical protein
MASKIKVDNIENQCGGAVVTKCGATTTISGSVVKADDIQAADGGNLINQCGTTITLGASGDTINLASGASQTGFGRTGTVDWDTTAKTASFTAVSGNGYFVNTTSGAITVTLPAGSPGDIVGISDYASTFQTNNLTIAPSGSDKINGVDQPAVVSTQGLAVSLVYVDSTRGWKSVTGSDSNTTGIPLPAYVTATGGTITTCGDYKIHTFTGPGTFTVSCAGNCQGSDSVDYLVVAGGGGTGAFACQTGGGGAGGFRLSNSTCMPAPQTSPLANPSGLQLSATAYPITVGAGGACGGGNPGSNSIFSTIISTGGGSGADTTCAPGATGDPGGSGGGSQVGAGAAGNTPPVSPPQGNPGGSGVRSAPNYGSGGGGGAGAPGGNGSSTTAGVGGAGSFVVSSGFAGCNGTPGPVCGARYFAGGGGGGGETDGAVGGVGGGGEGTWNGGSVQGGTVNTGGGAGSGNDSTPAGASGGSGIVIIRYKYQ